MSATLQVVLGAGQVGTRLVSRLRARGLPVRVVRQRPMTRADGVEQLSGDLADVTFAERACAGAAVVYDCTNPPYWEWRRLLLPMGRAILHGTTRAGARLVALDNLYMYGKVQGPMREDTPRTPVSVKGSLRAELESLRLEAMKRGELQVSIGRASDFYGVDLPNSFFSPRFFERIMKGKAGECTGSPLQPHTYSYVEDVARGLETLGTEADTAGIWHFPAAPAESTQALTSRFGQALGLKNARAAQLPPALLWVASAFSPFMRELREMTYQWEAPFVLDDSKFVARFGWRATPVEQGVEQTAQWVRQRFGLTPKQA